MNHPSDAVMRPPLPAGAEPGPVITRRAWLRLLAWSAAGLVLALAVLCAYALVYPERMPPAVGALVEDITGANPHPVQLMRPQNAPLSAVALLGKQIFFDPTLSASGAQSCASCHSPQHSYAPDNAFPIQLGGAHMSQAGYRPPPSLAYLYRQAPFSIGPDQGDTDVPVDMTQLAAQAAGVQRAQKTALAAPAAPAMVPQGGLFWDGRADTLQNQALGPLMNPVEMANATEADVAHKLLQTTYLDQFKKIFGPSIVSNPSLLISEAMFAVGRYPDRRSIVPCVHQQVRLLARRQGTFDACRAARSAIVQRQGQGELRGLPLEPAEPRWPAAGLHRHAVRGARRAAQSGDSGQQGSEVLRYGRVRPVPRRPRASRRSTAGCS